MFQDADHISIYMSFTHSTFTFINCEDPSKRFTITNDEIRQMELKINVAYRRSGNWEHIANHLYNFYSKIGVIGQPKSNRNVYSNEYTELLELKDKSYADVLKEDRLIRQEQGVQIKYAKDDAHLLNKKQHIERHASWENRGEWHIDHVVPCCAFGATIEEQKVLHWYGNLRPMLAKDNLIKNGRYNEEDKIALIKRYNKLNNTNYLLHETQILDKQENCEQEQ